MTHLPQIQAVIWVSLCEVLFSNESLIVISVSSLCKICSSVQAIYCLFFDPWKWQFYIFSRIEDLGTWPRSLGQALLLSNLHKMQIFKHSNFCLLYDEVSWEFKTNFYWGSKSYQDNIENRPRIEFYRCWQLVCHLEQRREMIS